MRRKVEYEKNVFTEGVVKHWNSFPSGATLFGSVQKMISPGIYCYDLVSRGLFSQGLDLMILEHFSKLDDSMTKSTSRNHSVNTDIS